MSMNVTLQSTQELIAKVQADIDNFHQKRPVNSLWMNSYEAAHHKAVDSNIREFASILAQPPYNGSAQEMIDYYTHALKLMKHAKINEQHVSFEASPEGMEASLFVTLSNTMTDAEYYKEVVFNKGQLISFEKENQRNLDKAHQIHADYTKDLDAEVKKKLDDIHLSKTQPFKDIDALLQNAISLVTAEEMKYKPVKQNKMK
jgi:hypothetical protein